MTPDYTGDLVHGQVDEELLDEGGGNTLSRVAEKSSFWPPSLVSCRMRCTGSRKPRSHMWSASSSTVTNTLDRSSRPLLNEILDAAGRGDHDVNAALQSRDLLVLGHATDDGRGE